MADTREDSFAELREALLESWFSWLAYIHVIDSVEKEDYYNTAHQLS